MRCASCVWKRAHSTGEDAENLNSGLEGVCRRKEEEEEEGEMGEERGGEGGRISRRKDKGRNKGG